MNVAVLQQYLRSLIAPLRAFDASARAVADFEQLCAGLNPFSSKNVAELAEFLQRAQGYEADGHWPEQRPSIQGELVDDPSLDEYAQRLRTFLTREVRPGESIPEAVRAELDKIEKKLKPAELQQIATLLGLAERVTTKKKAIEQIVLTLTGQSLKPARAAKKKSPVMDPTDVQQLANRLRELADSSELEAELEKLKSLQLGDVRAVAQAIGVGGNVSKKDQGIKKIRDQLASSGEPTDASQRIDQFVATLSNLKSRADQPGAPYAEIEEELRKVEDAMDRDLAVEVGRRFTEKPYLSTRTEALEAIRWKVFAARRTLDEQTY